MTEIYQRIHASGEAGAISFAEFMEIALYDPEAGYYADPASRPIGRGGDFFTSVSVGDCFGLLLGWEIERRWRENFGGPGNFAIVEQGAHDGRLAADLLAGLEERGSELAAKARYVIIEPSESGRRRLAERLASRIDSGCVEIVDRAASLRVPCGVFLCNELLDAFPVHRIRMENGQWRERWVKREAGGRLDWVSRDLESPDLAGEICRLGDDFPEGYTTEICLAVRDWFQEIARIFERGCWWVIDYGYEDSEYYASVRHDGTLRCYRDHQPIDDPLVAPGETDITAHVDFSRLIRAAGEAGLENTLCVDQHDFLTRAALPWLTGLEEAGVAPEPGNRKRLRQFQTLTHPGMMGRVFKVAEFVRA